MPETKENNKKMVPSCVKDSLGFFCPFFPANQREGVYASFFVGSGKENIMCGVRMGRVSASPWI